jgi:hypothetical protein
VTCQTPTFGVVVAGKWRFNVAPGSGASRIDYVMDGVDRGIYDGTPTNFAEDRSNAELAAAGVGSGPHSLVCRATISGSRVDSAPVSFTIP